MSFISQPDCIPQVKTPSGNCASSSWMILLRQRHRYDSSFFITCPQDTATILFLGRGNSQPASSRSSSSRMGLEATQARHWGRPRRTCYHHRPSSLMRDPRTILRVETASAQDTKRIGAVFLMMAEAPVGRHHVAGARTQRQYLPLPSARVRPSSSRWTLLSLVHGCIGIMVRTSRWPVATLQLAAAATETEMAKARWAREHHERCTGTASHGRGMHLSSSLQNGSDGATGDR